MASYRKYKNDKEKVDSYNHRVQQAERVNEKWHPIADRYIKRYEARSRPETRTANGHNLSGATPTIIGIIDSLYSSMTAVEVDLVVTPKGNTGDEEAYVATAALNQEWDTTKTPERGNEAVKDALLVGIGWLKVGYAYYELEEEVPRAPEDIQRDAANMMQEAIDSGVPERDQPTVDDIARAVPLTAVETVTIDDRVVVDYVPWDMVLWDPTAKRFGDVCWVAQKQLMHPDDVKNNPEFQEYAAQRKHTKQLNDLSADTHLSKEIIGELADKTEEDERITVYTLTDFETGTVCTFAKDATFLLNENINPFSIFDEVEDQSPFVPLVLRKSPGRVRGVSEMEVLAHAASEKDLYHSRLGTFLERMAPKYLAKSRAFTPAGKKALQSQEYGAVIEMEEGFDPQTDVKDSTPPKLMSEMYDMPNRLEQAMRDAVGVSELMRGLFPDRKRTATETTEVVTASAARQAEKRTQLEGFWQAVAQRILVLMQAYYDKERVVKLADEAGEVAWTWTAEDIAGQFSLETHLTPREAKTWQTRRDNALATLNIVAPLASPDPKTGEPAADITELLRYVLTELNIPRRIITRILNLPEEKQMEAMKALQHQAQQAEAAQGVPPTAGGVPGPMSEYDLAAATNQGTLPPEILAGAAGVGPTAPEAAEQVSESGGIIRPRY